MMPEINSAQQGLIPSMLFTPVWGEFMLQFVSTTVMTFTSHIKTVCTLPFVTKKL